MFVRADESEAQVLLDILHSDEVAWGQVVNLDESEVSSNRKVSNNMCNMPHEKLGFEEVDIHQCYLGLSTFI